MKNALCSTNLVGDGKSTNAGRNAKLYSRESLLIVSQTITSMVESISKKGKGHQRHPTPLQ
jgi:hypothetical protein